MRVLLCFLSCLLGLTGCGDSTPSGPPKDAAPALEGRGNAPTAPEQKTIDTRADVVGRWASTSVPGDMWIAVRDDGRYRYSGLPTTRNPAADGVPGTDISGTGGTFPWMTAHTGTWIWKDGDLTLTPDEEKGRDLLPFEFDADEGSLNLQVIGRGPTGPRWIVFWRDAAN